MAKEIQLKRATSARWTSINPILLKGEPGIEQETGSVESKMKIGDGVTHWNDLPYAGTIEINYIKTALGAGVAVGDTYQGGLVARINGDGTYYIITPLGALSDSAWSNVLLSQTFPAGIGYGSANTDGIIAQSGHTASAAKEAKDLVHGGFADWFLPSINELYTCVDNLIQAGYTGFPAGTMIWSSTTGPGPTTNNAKALIVGTSTNAGTNKSKLESHSVVAVRISTPEMLLNYDTIEFEGEGVDITSKKTGTTIAVKIKADVSQMHDRLHGMTNSLDHAAAVESDRNKVVRSSPVDGSWQLVNVESFDTLSEMTAFLTVASRYAGQKATCKEIDGTIFVLSKDLSKWVPSDYEYITIGTYRDDPEDNSTVVIQNNDYIMGAPHGNIKAKNRFYIGSRGFDIVQRINPNDVMDFQTVHLSPTLLPSDPDYIGNIESMCYDAVHDKIYAISANGVKAMIVQIDPDDITDFSTVFHTTAFTFGLSPGIATDGTHVYVASYEYGGFYSHLYKIRIIDWTVVQTVTLTGYANAHSCQMYHFSDRWELYVTCTLSGYSNGVFLKVNPDTLACTAVSIASLNPTDDFAIKYKDETGVTAYVIGEANNLLSIVDTATMTATNVSSMGGFSVIISGDYLYVASGGVMRHELADLSKTLYNTTVNPSNGGMTTVNELFVSDDGGLFYTFWNPFSEKGSFTQFSMYEGENGFNIYNKRNLRFEGKNGVEIEYDAVNKKVIVNGAGALGTQVQSDWEQSNSAAVDYIKHKPAIPAAPVNADWNATSGLAQILNKPTIPASQVQSDWSQSNNAQPDFIKNKPTIPAAPVNADWNATSGLAQILNKPSIPAAQVQSDWEQEDSGQASFVNNRPYLETTNTTAQAATTERIKGTIKLHKIAKTGTYSDLIGKPTIPAAQVNSDWNATSGVAQILNKPTIPAAQVNSDWNATSGVAQILNKPTIPAQLLPVSDILYWDGVASKYVPYSAKKGTDPGYAYFYTGSIAPTFVRRLNLDGQLNVSQLIAINANYTPISGSSTDAPGISGESANDVGLKGSSTYLWGVWGSGGEIGVVGSSVSGIGLKGLVNPSNANGLIEVIRAERSTSGTPASGIGAYYSFAIESLKSTVTPIIAGYFSTKLTSVTADAESATMEWYLKSAGLLARKMALTDIGDLILDTYGSGSHTGTPAKALQVTASGKVIEGTLYTGTVSSVGLTMPSNEFSVSNSPVQGAGTLIATWKPQLANKVFAGPFEGDGGTVVPTFRSLIEADIPPLPYLMLSGGTMTGPIVLPGNPTLGLHAASKAYVDGLLSRNNLEVRVFDFAVPYEAVVIALEPKALYNYTIISVFVQTQNGYLTINFQKNGSNLTSYNIGPTGNELEPGPQIPTSLSVGDTFYFNKPSAGNLDRVRIRLVMKRTTIL